MSYKHLLVLFSLTVFTATSANVSAQSESGVGTFDAAQVLPLYEGVAPGSEKWNYSEKVIEGKSGPQVRNVVKPTLLYFPASKPNGTAMIVAPGGGNRTLMMSYEGVDIARKLNALGVDAFVLKYRLNFDASLVEGGNGAVADPQAGQDVRALSADDGRRAMEVLRARVSEFKYQPDRIGMIGFSAGGGPVRGSLESPVATRPNFAALIYAGPSRDGSVKVPEDAPPLFIAVSADDRLSQVSIDTFLAWRAAERKVELHIFQMGAHGFVNRGGGADHFMDRLAEWMQVNGWLTVAR